MQGIVGTRDNPGAIIEYLEPFVGASIATNIGLDLARNTTYASGSAQRIWNSTDDAGLVSQKILAHVVNSAAPPILPATIKPGRPGDMGPLFWKDLPRATLNTLGLANTPLNSKGIRPNTYGQIAESFTGLKTIKPTIERTLGFRALDAKEQMREAVSYYTAAVSNPNILEDQNGSSVDIWINENKVPIEDLIKIVSNWTYWIHVNQPLYLEAESILKLMHESIKNHPVLDDDDYDNSLVGIEAGYGAWEYDSYEAFVKEEYDDKHKDKKAIYKKYRDYMDSIYYDENEQDIIFVNDYNDAKKISEILGEE